MKILAVFLALVAVAQSAAVQTLYLSEEQKTITWKYGSDGNGEESSLTLQCGTHGFSLDLQSPDGTESQVQLTSPHGCRSNLRCEGPRPEVAGLSFVNPADYEDEMSSERSAPAQCKNGRVDWSYETCMNAPVQDGKKITYTATALIKQSHEVGAIKPCKLDHQTIVKISCCVNPPDIQVDVDDRIKEHEMKACEKAEFEIKAEQLQSSQSDHISWAIVSNINWDNHDHVGWFVDSCKGTANSNDVQLFHHTTSNIQGGRTQNCDFPDVTVARNSKPRPLAQGYVYVFDSPFVLPKGTDPEKFSRIVISCQVRFCNKGTNKLFASDCPIYPTAIATSLAAAEPTCPVTMQYKGQMLPGKVSVDHSF